MSLRTLLLIYEACVIILTYRPRRSPVHLFVLVMLSIAMLYEFI